VNFVVQFVGTKFMYEKVFIILETFTPVKRTSVPITEFNVL